MMRVSLLGLVCVLAGCQASEPEADGKVPGELLGTFAASGEIVKDSCGADLLGAPDPWRFEVKLSQFDLDLYWLNGREAIVGDIDADGEKFRFLSGVEAVVEPRRGASPGCTISREDRAEGVLTRDGDEVSGFDAELTYQYRAKSGTECSEFIGVVGAVYALPCELRYRIRAVH